MNYRPPEHLTTARFHLRRALPSDAKAVFESYATDETVTTYLGWKPHRTPTETEAFLNVASAEWESGRGYPFVISPKEDESDVIGMVHPHVAQFKINYGYVLARRAWGRGCASEVLGWLVEHALSDPKIHRAEAFCDVENRASARVMEKAGMVLEGRLRRFFVHPNISDLPRDCFIYSRIR